MNMHRLYVFQMLTTDNEFVNKVACIRGLRSLTGMGLKDAKDFVESVQSEAECHTNPQERRIPVQTEDLNQIYTAISMMESGGISCACVENVDTNLRMAIKAAAELAIKEDEITIALDLVKILDYYRP